MNLPTARRLTTMLLVLLLVFSLVPQARAADEEGARSAIIIGFESLAETLDLSIYSLTFEELDALFSDLRDGGALPWYAQGFTYYSSTGKAELLYWEDSEYDWALYEQRAAEILAATVFPGMTDWQIALSIHDYLAAWNAYDDTLANHRGHDLLVQGVAVCEGYSEAYMDLLTRAGVPCRIVISEEMNHSWNLVQIGGAWYHVDITWDDPSPDQEGLVLHDYFLLSDEAISDAEHGHYGWESDIACTDTTMDTGRFWQDIDSQICYESADTCYFRTRNEATYTVYRRTERDGSVQVIDSFESESVNIGSGFYIYYNNGLSLWNGRLYYSDARYVFSVKTDGSDKQTVHYHDAAANGTVMRGTHVENGLLYVTYGTHSNTLTQKILRLPEAGHTHAPGTGQTAPDCYRAGFTTYTCGCGLDWHVKDAPALGHTYDAGTVILEPTVSTAGQRRYACIRCGLSYTVEIPRLPPPDTVPTAAPSSATTRTEWRPTAGSTYDSSGDEAAVIVCIAAIAAVSMLLLRKKKK